MRSADGSIGGRIGRAADPAALRRQRWCASVALGAFAVFGSGSTLPPTGGSTMPGTTGPIDRTTVALPPTYPAPPTSFLRLPSTRIAPVKPPAPARFSNGSVVPGGQGTLWLPGPGPATRAVTADRPVWTPARIEPVVGLDANGHVTSVLEYTPGRFEH